MEVLAVRSAGAIGGYVIQTEGVVQENLQPWGVRNEGQVTRTTMKAETKRKNMSVFKHQGPGPLYELRRTAYLTGDDEGGTEIPAKLIGRYKSEAAAVRRGQSLKLDPDMHYVARIHIVHSEAGFWPVWSDDDDYGHCGKYLNEFSA